MTAQANPKSNTTAQVIWVEDMFLLKLKVVG
jgi:hypothetical protein